jgi:hypothetical protein
MRQQVADPEEVRRIIRLIDSDPQVRDEVRRAILTQELLELPQRLAAFIEATDRRFQVIEADLEVLKTDVGVLKTDVGVLKTDVQVLKTDFADFKGDGYERRVRERAPAILSRVAGGMRRIRLISVADLADQLDEAVEAGRIGDAERDEVLRVDAVARAVSRASGQAVHLVIEASVTLGKADVVRAIRRSRLVAQGLETEAVPVVVTTRAPEKVSTKGVEVVTFGYGDEQGAA